MTTVEEPLMPDTPAATDTPRTDTHCGYRFKSGILCGADPTHDIHNGKWNKGGLHREPDHDYEPEPHGWSLWRRKCTDCGAAEAAAAPQVQADPPAEGLLREALANLVGMVEENGPDFADADAMVDARRALGVGIHDVVELAAQGYRFAATSGLRAMLPTRLLRTEWPPNDGVLPGDPRFDALFESIREEGIREPLTINLGWFVIDGNHRLSAARLLGIECVPVRVWTGVEFLPPRSDAAITDRPAIPTAKPEAGAGLDARQLAAVLHDATCRWQPHAGFAAKSDEEYHLARATVLVGRLATNAAYAEAASPRSDAGSEG